LKEFQAEGLSMLRNLLVILVIAISTFSNGSSRADSKVDETTQTEKQLVEAGQPSSSPVTLPGAPVINVYTAKHEGEESHCISPKGWTGATRFVWCRSTEWIDAEKTIAIFTVILGIATGLLWMATDRLVKGAERASQQQLRAYLSVNPFQILSSDQDERFVRIICNVRNHGQTPARKVNYIFDFDVLPNPLPDDFEFPAASFPINYDATVFPLSDMKVWFNFNRLLTVEEFAAVEADSLRLHIWGKAFYKTAFGEQRYTIITGSVGGADFVANLRNMKRKKEGPPFNWTYEIGHGDGD
jgi:hypothetical protein